MAITVNQASNPADFESTHIMHFRTLDNKEYITLSGIVKTELRNEHANLFSKREELKIILSLDPVLPSGKWFRMEQGVPMVTVNSFLLKHGDSSFLQSDRGFRKGIAIDTFSIDRHEGSWGIGVVTFTRTQNLRLFVAKQIP